MIEIIERVQGEDRPDLPIVVGLHFAGSDAATIDRMLFAGMQGEFRFVFPSGTHLVDGCPSWYPVGYYDLDERRQAAVVRRVAGEIAGVLDQLIARYPKAGCPIVVGASQGGDLAAALAILFPDRVRLSVAIAASAPTPIIREANQLGRLRFLHGVEDTIVPVGDPRASVAILSRLTPQPTLTEYAGVGHAVPDEMRRDLHAAIAAGN